MDFEARDSIWATLQVKSPITEDSSNTLCKVCIALEIFKLAVCAGDCNQCESNLLSTLTEIIPQNLIDPHLSAIKSSVGVRFKLEELEKKLPMYVERQQSSFNILNKKVEMLAAVAEKLRLENLSLKDKILMWQLTWMELQEKNEKVKNELGEIKAFQSQLMKTVQSYLSDSKVLWEVVNEYMRGKSMEIKVSELDDLVIEEITKMDYLWEDVKNLKEAQDSLKSELEDLKKIGKHCYNLDLAVEQVLECNFKAYDLQKIIETRLQELGEYLGIKQIEIANEEYRNKVLELRKKTSECFLKPN